VISSGREFSLGNRLSKRRAWVGSTRQNNRRVRREEDICNWNILIGVDRFVQRRRIFLLIVFHTEVLFYTHLYEPCDIFFSNVQRVFSIVPDKSFLDCTRSTSGHKWSHEIKSFETCETCDDACIPEMGAKILFQRRNFSSERLCSSKKCDWAHTEVRGAQEFIICKDRSSIERRDSLSQRTPSKICEDFPSWRISSGR
jgi:hypothetical protein